MVKIQFIAGAICPQCKAADVIQQIHKPNEPIHWQCVECDFVADENNLPSSEDAGDSDSIAPNAVIDATDVSVKWR